MMTQPISELKPVLLVVSSCAVKGATGIPTGYNLAEATHPLKKLQAVGIRVEFASPQGGDAPLDGLEDMKVPVIAKYWSNNVVIDGSPITGQNPQSATSLHGALRDALLA